MKNWRQWAGLLLVILAAAMPAFASQVKFDSQVTGPGGSYVVVRVSVDTGATPLQSFDAWFTFDDTKVDYLGAFRNGFTSDPGAGFGLVENVVSQAGNDLVKLGLYSSIPPALPAGYTEVLWLLFRNHGTGSALTWDHPGTEVNGAAVSGFTDGAISTAAGTYVLFSMPHNASTTPGGTVQVPIYADDVHDLRSFDIVLEFNPAVVTVPSDADVALAPATAGFTLTPNTHTPGRVGISLYRADGIAGSGRQPIALVTFHAVGGLGATTPLDIVSVITNDLTATAIDDGELRIDGDADGDGYTVFGGDCNDHNAAIHPGATETPNDGVDQNCDGLEECYIDADGDTFGNSGGATTTSSALTCVGPGVANNTLDCLDSNAAVNPNALEVCGNGLDDNCDGHIDSGTRYVATTGNDTANDCTGPAHACRTIQHAVDQSCGAPPLGDTILVAAGSYAESVNVPKPASLHGAKFGVAVGTRTAGDTATESVVTGAVSGLPVFNVTAAGVVVDGFDITGGAAWAGVVAFGGSAPGFGNVTVAHDFIHDVTFPNPNSTSFHFSHGLLVGSGSPGARPPVSGIAFQGNAVYRLGNAGVNPGNGVYGTALTGATAGAGASITGNSFTDLVSVPATPGIAVYVDVANEPATPASGVLISGNTYTNLGLGAGFYATSSTFDELHAAFTGVPVFAVDAVSLATVNETHLLPYAKSNLPTGVAPGSRAWYATIQRAVNGSDAGATVDVTAGTWPEHVTVATTKTGMTLLGPNAGVAGSGVRAPEAVITAVASDPSWTSDTCTFLMSVLASNVTVKGFTFDGDNPAFLPPIDACVGLADEADNVAPYTPVDGTLVQNNIFRNIGAAAIDLRAAGSSTATAGTVTDNRFENIDGDGALGGWGIGVYFGDNHYGQVTNNVFRAVRKGVQLGNFHRAKAPGASALIAGNDVQSAAAGIWHNLLYDAASAWEIRNNTLAAVPASANRGIWLTSVQGTVTVNVHDNHVTGGAAGIAGWNITSTGTITVDHNDVADADYGVRLFSTDYQAGNHAPATLSVTRLTATGCKVACAAALDDPATAEPQVLTVSESSLTGAGAAGTSVGVLSDGAGANVTVHRSDIGAAHQGVLARNGGLADVSTNHIVGNFTGVENQTATTVQATCVYWGAGGGPGAGGNNGVSGPVNAAPYDLDTNYDNFFTFYVDADGDGYGNPSGSTLSSCNVPPGYSADLTDCDDTRAAVNPGALEVCGNLLDDNCDGAIDMAPGGTRFVAKTGSDALDCTTPAKACLTIQRGVDEACGGETVDVGAGAYLESVNVAKPLALRGAQHGAYVSTRTPGSAPETVVTGTGGAVFNVSSGNVTLDGFDIVGGAAWAGVVAFSSSAYSNVSIVNNYIHGVSAGNPNSSSNYSHGVLVGSGSRGARVPVTGVVVNGNVMYDLGVAGGHPGVGVYAFALAGGSPGAGALVTNNAFHDIASGPLTPTPKVGLGVIIDMGQDDASGNPTAPSSGVTVAGNTYARVFGGASLFATSSVLGEQHAQFTDVTMYAANVGRQTTTFNAPQLAPYAKTDAPTGVPSTDAYFSTIGAAVTASDAGAHVDVTAGTFAEDNIVLGKALELRGAGAASTTIDATASSAGGKVVFVDVTSPGSNVLVDGFTVKTGALMNGIFFRSIGATSSTITISNNHVVGWGHPLTDYRFDYGIIGGYNGVAKVVVDHNTVDSTSNNPVLFERQEGESVVSSNTLTVPDDSTGVFFMTYEGDTTDIPHPMQTITTLQSVTGNTITIPPSATSGSGGVVFAIYDGGSSLALPKGRFTNVSITGNTIGGLFANPAKAAIALREQSTDGSAAIEGAVVSGNTITGTPGSLGTGVLFRNNVTGGHVANNTISGVATGVSLNTLSSGTPPSGALITGNDITSCTAQAIYTVTGGTGSASGNNLPASNAVGATNASTTVPFDATCNFWGAVSGPNTPGASTTVGNVVASAWLMVNDHDTDLDGDHRTSCTNAANYDCDVNNAAVGFTPYFLDADGDLYGKSGSTPVPGCAVAPPVGYVTDATDCDDTLASVHPGATEVVNDGRDENCDGLELCYVDGDLDTFGTATETTTTSTVLTCLAAGVAGNHTDCNDANAAIHPGATELCNAVDDNCDGVIDGALADADCTERPLDNVCTTDVCSIGVCSHTAPASCGISGQLFYGKVSGLTDLADTTKPVKGTSIGLTADVDYDHVIDVTAPPSVTTATGLYTFGAVNGDVTTRPFGRSLTWAQLSTGVGSFDATAIAKYVVGITSLSPNQLAVADASGNGAVTSFDASYVAQFSAHLIEHLPVAVTAGSDFAYFPVSRNYPSLSSTQTGQDYVALLYGDVTENFDPVAVLGSAFAAPVEAPALSPAPVVNTGGAHLYLASGPRRTADGHVEVVLGLQNADGILGFDARLVYDPRAVEVVNVRTAPLAAAFALVQNRRDDGYAIGLYGTAPLLGTGEFLVVTFDQKAPLAGEPFTIEAEANEGQIPLTWGPGLPSPAPRGTGTHDTLNLH